MNRVYAHDIHPACSFLFFVLVIAFTLTCLHPVMAAISCLCAGIYLVRLGGWEKLAGVLRFALPLFLIITVANPLFNHRGVTMLFLLFNQWITWEAVVYGIVSGMQFVAILLWFACYQVVITSDKFLYLFGAAAPSAALLVTLTLRMIPQLRAQLEQITLAQRLLGKKPGRLLHKLNDVIRRLSTLLTWSMENAVETADSMKARGYGVRRRTTFHLFHFDTRDAAILTLLPAVGGVLLIGRAFGHGVMEFYPRMDRVITGQSGVVTYAMFFLLGLLPSLFEWVTGAQYRRYFESDREVGT